MARELGGIFGISVTVATFAAAGDLGSPAAFADGLGPALVVSGALSLLGMFAALGVPGRVREVAQPVTPPGGAA